MSDFSVIIPTRNRDHLLNRAVQSVLKQQSVTLELIVVDDGDQIESKKQLELYCKEYGIRYLKTGGNKGGGVSRNLGLDYARNNLVAFLDDDDYWKSDKLQKQALLMSDSDVGLCYTGVIISKSNISQRYHFRKPCFDDPFKAIMKHNFIGTTSSVVVRKSVLQQIGGFDGSLPALQDYDLYIRILKKWKLSWTAEPLTVYDDHISADRVSSSRKRYLKAVPVMLKKYENEKYYSLLYRSLRFIEILKICRSKQFLIETIKSFFLKKRFEND